MVAVYKYLLKNFRWNLQKEGWTMPTYFRWNFSEIWKVQPEMVTVIFAEISAKFAEWSLIQ